MLQHHCRSAKKYELVKIADTKEDFVEDVLKLAEKRKVRRVPKQVDGVCQSERLESKSGRAEGFY